MKTFKDILNEAKADTVAFTFGRLNPPTVGHGKLLDALKKQGSDYRLYMSKSHDPKKNPLSFKEKVYWVKTLFPQHYKAIQSDADIVMVFDVLMKLQNEGIKNVIMVVGSDRVKEFEDLLNKYNGVEARHGKYDFDSIKVVSAGERDPDADDVSGMSASKMRKAVSENDFDTFKTGVPKGMSEKDIQSYFDDVKKGMNL